MGPAKEGGPPQYVAVADSVKGLCQPYEKEKKEKKRKSHTFCPILWIKYVVNYAVMILVFQLTTCTRLLF